MNVLLVMVDQLVPFLTGTYGHRLVQTPALDRLAEDGIRYDAAYTPYPLCAPARAALLTGRYASRLGCYDNAAILHADEPTIAHHLTNAGYECALSGKMHFVGPDQLHGFRRRLTTDVFPAGMDWVPTQDPEGRFVRGGHAVEYVPPKVGVRTWTKFLSFDEETHFRAHEFLRERAREEREEPFFLVVSYHHPHDPFQPTQELWDLYDGVDFALPDRGEPNYTAMDVWANEAHETDAVDLDSAENLQALRRAYAALVTYVDRKLGELLDCLEQTGRADDTLVVFTSDHGDMLGERRMVQKRTFYEWSVRVPLVLRLPGREQAGTTVERSVSLLDLAPTLLDLAGVPDSERTALDGTSLFGAGGPVFSEYHVEKVRAPCFMVRQGRFKEVYVHGHDSRRFDLAADPGEWNDLGGGVLLPLILDRFDPDAIAAEGRESVARRDVIRRAMERNGTTWDYTPPFDATKAYVR